MRRKPRWPAYLFWKSSAERMARRGWSATRTNFARYGGKLEGMYKHAYNRLRICLDTLPSLLVEGIVQGLDEAEPVAWLAMWACTLAVDTVPHAWGALPHVQVGASTQV